MQRTGDVRKIHHAHEIASLIKAGEIVDPWECSHVGDRESVAHDPGPILELAVKYAQQTLRFRDIAVARTLVFEVLAGEFIESRMAGILLLGLRDVNSAVI